MKRRRFIVAATSVAALAGCGPLLDPGRKSPARPKRVGILDPSAPTDPIANAYIAGLKEGLAELGYVEGATIVYEVRGADANFALLPELASELVQLPVDLIVAAAGSNATIAAQRETAVIPIVFVGNSDPVGLGIVASMAHPGGNTTGDTIAPPSVWGKQLEILAQLLPGLSRVAVMVDLETGNSNSLMLGRVQAIVDAANSTGVQVRTLPVRSPADIDPDLAEALAWQAQAIMHLGGPGALTDATPRVAEFAKQNRVALMTDGLQYVQAGGLVGYGVNAPGVGRLAATYVDRILKGAQPRDLPVAAPTAYDLVINQNTAQALGLTIPPEVAQQVTEWVQ